MRKMKVCRKISGGFRSEQRARDFATLRSVLSSARKARSQTPQGPAATVRGLLRRTPSLTAGRSSLIRLGPALTPSLQQASGWSADLPGCLQRYLHAFYDLKIGHLGWHSARVSPNVRQSSSFEACQFAQECVLYMVSAISDSARYGRP